jgi:hypothetical protein
MTTITNSALAAQVYGATAQPHQRHHTAKAHKTEESPRSEANDQVTLRSAAKTQSAPASDAASQTQGAAATKAAYKRPGSLIDIKA